MSLMSSKKTITLLVFWAITLIGFWLLLSGYFKPLLLGLGLVSVVLVVFLLHRMNRFDGLNLSPPLSFPLFYYIGWLIGQVVLSSLEVTKLVWSKNKKLSPAIGKLPVTNTSVKTQALYANSITLTPGTLSIDVDDEYVTVHALDEQSIDALKSGEMARRVSTAAGVKT